MELEEYLNYIDDYDILDDEELLLLDDNHLIERMEAQSKRRKELMIKRNIDDWK